MGVMRFAIDPLSPEELGETVLRSYMVGYDGRVMQTRVEYENEFLICTRAISDSGKVKLAWPVEGRGLVSLSTTSLREREMPYLLSVELARGAICELRNQAAMWALGGMAVPDAYRKADRAAFKLFAKAACSQAENPVEAAELGREAIAAACHAGDELMRAYTLQKLASQGRGRQLGAVLGCGVSDPPQAGASSMFSDVFTAASVSIRWAEIEQEEGQYDWAKVDELVTWAEQNGLYVRGGPLLDFSEIGMPSWLGQWAHDLLSVQSFLCDFVETAMARHRGSVKFWDIAVGGCTGGAFNLTEEQRLTLVARVLDAARKVDDDSHTYVRINNPWGEYQRHGQHKLSPLQFVDALARSNLGLEGVCLDLDLADPHALDGTRSLFDVSRLIDQWSVLGLPLQILTTVSSDPERRFSEESQLKWLNDYLPLIVGKPSVSGVFYSHFSDASPFAVAGAGVLREDGTPKPVYDLFSRHSRAQST